MTQFHIPDRAITYPFQSRWFESDTVILGMSAGGKNGVIAGGCEVTESAIPGATTLVSAGQVVLAGSLVDVSGQTVGHDVADALLPRFDLVVVYDDGTAAALAGTPDAAPLPPLPDTDSIALGQVFIPAGDTAIEDAQIVDKRVLVASPIAATNWIGVSCTDDLPRASNASLTADPVLQVPLSAGGTYRIKMTVVFLVGDSSGGSVKWGWGGPPAMTRLTGFYGQSAVTGGSLGGTLYSASSLNGQSGSVTSFIFNNSLFAIARGEFFITNGVNAGAFSLIWGQSQSSLITTTRCKGSLLEYQIV